MRAVVDAVSDIEHDIAHNHDAEHQNQQTCIVAQVRGEQRAQQADCPYAEGGSRDLDESVGICRVQERVSESDRRPHRLIPDVFTGRRPAHCRIGRAVRRNRARAVLSVRRWGPLREFQQCLVPYGPRWRPVARIRWRHFFGLRNVHHLPAVWTSGRLTGVAIGNAEPPTAVLTREPDHARQLI